MLFFLRQTGLSLVQGLIVSSLVAGSALISTRLIQDQKLLLKSTESRDQIDQLHRMVYATLQNREHCKATLVSNSIAVANLNDGARTLTKVVTKTNTGATADVFQINDGSSWDPSKIYMNGNVMIRSMTFLTPQATDPAGQNNITYPSKLRVEYARMEGKDANKRTKVGYGGKQIKKDIPIILQRNTSTGAIDGCYAVQLGQDNNGMLSEGNNNINQEFCSKLGTNGSLYIWDSAANKCVLKNNVCPPKFVFAGINSNGNANCKPLTDYLGYMIDTSSVANCPSGASVSLTTDAAGKVKVTCSATASCTSSTVNWTYTTSSSDWDQYCSATAPIGTLGQSTTVTDSTGLSTGTATITCTATGWTTSSPNCTTASPNCPSYTGGQWQNGGPTCYPDAPGIMAAATPGSYATRTDSTGPDTGSIVYRCNGPNWVVQSVNCGAPCTPSASQPYGDGVDNDCDGSVDEYAYSVGGGTYSGCQSGMQCLQDAYYSNGSDCTGSVSYSGGPYCGYSGYCSGWGYGVTAGSGCSWTDPGTTYYD